MLYHLMASRGCSGSPASIWLSCKFPNWEISNSLVAHSPDYGLKAFKWWLECKFSHYCSEHLSIFYPWVNNRNQGNGGKKSEKKEVKKIQHDFKNCQYKYTIIEN